MRRTSLLPCLMLSALGLCSVEWSRTYSWSVPEPNSLDDGWVRDAQNNLFLTGMTGNHTPTIWKLDSSASLVFRNQLPTGIVQQKTLLMGSHSDLFYVGQGAARLDQATGSTLWTVPSSDAATGYVDENGDLYLVSRYTLRTEKRAFGTGELIWSAPLQLMPLEGSNFLASTTNGVFLASKATGQVISSVPLSPAPVGRLRGFALPGGNAFLIDSKNRGYGYRKVGVPLNLGFINPFDTIYDVRISPEGYSIVHGGNTTTCISPSFHTAWIKSGSARVTDFDGPNALMNEDPIVVATGQPVPSESGYGRGYLGDNLWSFSHTVNSQEGITLRDRKTNGFRPGWMPSETVAGAGRILTGRTGPNGDLFLVNAGTKGLKFVRISPSGDLVWSIPINGGNTEKGAGISFSKDGSSAFIWFASGSFSSTEVDLIAGKVVSYGPGQIIAKGDFIYRTNIGSNLPVRTSKFDGITRREIWRIPRAGLMNIADDGSVFVNEKKNKALDGQLVWKATDTRSALYPFGDRIAKVVGSTLTWLHAGHGHPFWSVYLPATQDMNEREDRELVRRNGKIYVRWSRNADQAFEVDEATGAITGTGPWGFWDSVGQFYRVVGSKLVRCANFSDLAGTPVADLPGPASQFYPDGSGAVFIVSVDDIGAPGKWTISKWRS